MRNKVVNFLLFPLQVYYRLITNRYCIDLPPATKIGAGLKLNHSFGIVIHKNV